MIHAVLFDLDGTLLKQKIDFDAIRREIGAPEAGDIIEHLKTLPPAALERARTVVERHEKIAAAASETNAGALETLAFLERSGLPAAVFTRNSRASLRAAEERHGFVFAASVCRGETAPKPSPEPVLEIARALGLPPSKILAVGDYAYDMESALRAGSLCAFLSNEEPPRIATRAHYMLSCLSELVPLISGLRDGSIVPGPLREVEKGTP
jgi:HAD superfamily hydrolase (TIGR01549 family)